VIELLAAAIFLLQAQAPSTATAAKAIAANPLLAFMAKLGAKGHRCNLSRLRPPLGAHVQRLHEPRPALSSPVTPCSHVP